MEAFFLSILKRVYIILLILFFSHCNQPQRQVHRSFYYWKTAFSLNDKESDAIKDLSIEHLYIRLFDVEWNEEKKAPAPVSPIRFSDKPPSSVVITPVVFITNKTLQQSSIKQIEQLGLNIIRLMSGICSSNALQLSNEVQIDCDWNAGTKEKYFHLLRTIKQQPFLKNKKLSCTIRLHQLKFVSLNGVPPVDKGLLMCYNMGNLRHAETKNSIIANTELKKYTANMKTYVLPLDVALPLFDWHVWFKGPDYKGLIHELPGQEKDGNRIKFTKDTTIKGIHFTKEDWLRYESSEPEEIAEAARHLATKINRNDVTIILYHLSEDNLRKYKRHELENIFNSFR